MVRPPNVTIVALTKDKKIVLIKEILKGKMCLLLPGGKVEKYNPSPALIQRQALRELHEETGYKAKKIELLSRENSIWNTLDRQFVHYIAWDLEEVGQNLEEGENITKHLVTKKEAKGIITKRMMASPEEERTLIKALEAFQKKRLL